MYDRKIFYLLLHTLLKCSAIYLSRKILGKQYPMDCDPPSAVSTKLNVAERPTPIYSVKFSGNFVRFEATENKNLQ